MSGTRWERFAREDAEYYILTGLETEPDAGRLDAFFASGREQARAILERCAPTWRVTSSRSRSAAESGA